MTDDNFFTCVSCRQLILSSISHEEALKEASIRYPDEDPETLVQICDSCYRAYLAWERSKLIH